MASKENPCKSFAANIFDKNKCQNCFKPRDTHAHLTKDLSKAKPIYYGWLLLAPIGTDFTNLLHKNRKWQRRWFVLFEHGALRYALDDNASTVAQATIDMNVSSEVELADAVTEQKHTLCISTPEQNFYLRGENKEEIIGWRDALVVFPDTIKEEQRRKKKLKNRRSEVPLLPSSTAAAAGRQIDEARSTGAHHHHPHQRERSRTMSSSHVSEMARAESACSLPLSFTSPASALKQAAEQDDQQENRPPPGIDVADSAVFLRSPTSHRALKKTSSDARLRDMRREQRMSVESSTGGGGGGSTIGDAASKHLSSSTSSLDSTSGHSYLSVDSTSLAADSGIKHGKHRSSMKDRFARSSDNPTIDESPIEQQLDKSNSYPRSRSSKTRRARPKSAYISESTMDEVKAATRSRLTTSKSGSDLTSIASSPPPPPPPQHQERQRGRNISRRSTQAKQGTQSNKTSQQHSRPTAAQRRAKSLDRRAYDQITVSPDLFNVKNGLLTLIGEDGGWSRHWFVLSNNTLRYYKDSSAEHSAKADGEISLSGFIGVHEVDVQRQHGFQIDTDEGSYRLVAVTSGIRRGWIEAIKRSTSSSAHQHRDYDRSETQQKNPVTDEAAARVLASTTAPKEDAADAAAAELSHKERAERRKQRIRDRKRDGRARTFDFAEMRKAENAKRESDLVAQLTENPPPLQPKTNVAAAGEDKSTSENESTNHHHHHHHTSLTRRSSSSSSSQQNNSKKQKKKRLADSTSKFENAWRRMEKISIDIIGVDGSGDAPVKKNPLCETANMVKSLQNEIDSLKMQIEKVQVNKLALLEPSNDIYTVGHLSDIGRDDNLQVQNNKNNNDDDNRVHENDEIIKENIRLRQDLLESNETIHKQNRALEERGVELESLTVKLRRLSEEVEAEKQSRKSKADEYAKKVSTLTSALEAKDAQMNASRLDYEKQLDALQRRLKHDDDAKAATTTASELYDRLSAELEATRAKLATSRRDNDSLAQQLATAVRKIQLLQESTATTTAKPRESTPSEEEKNEAGQSRRVEDDETTAATPKNEKSEKSSQQQQQSSFRDKLNELEAEMGGTGQMIAAARKNALETSTTSSSSASPTAVTGFDLKIKKAEDDLAAHTRAISRVQEQFAEFESRMEREGDERWSAAQRCLLALHRRVRDPTHTADTAARMLDDVLAEILCIARGAPPPQAQQRDPADGIAKRLRQLAERLDSGEDANGADGAALEESDAILVKQISTQALLLSQMAASIRAIDSHKPPPSSSTSANSKRSSKSAEFGASYLMTGAAAPPNLLRHVDALARKLSLGGTLMQEIDRLRKGWRKQDAATASASPSSAVGGSKKNDFGDVGLALAAHSQISYTLQVYNERIQRLSFDLGQSRHKASAVMRKLVELVNACKTMDADQVSRLAVQVDIDSIASSYPELSPWQQQIDYGTLHGASASQAAESTSSSSEANNAERLDEEAAFFEKLALELSCMSIDFKSLVESASQIMRYDSTIQKLTRERGNLDELSSTIAMEAIIQSEIIYVAHRLRQDYERELKKMQEASGETRREMVERASECERLRGELKRSEQLLDQHRVEVEKLARAKREGEARAEEREKKIEELQEKIVTMVTRLDTLNKDHSKERGRLREQLADALRVGADRSSEMVEEWKRREESLVEEHERKVEEGEQRWRDSLARTQQEHARHVAQLEASHESTLDSARVSVERELIRKHEKEVQQLRDDHHVAVEKLKAESDSRQREAVEEATTVYEKKLEGLRVNHERALADERHKCDTGSEGLRAQIRALEEKVSTAEGEREKMRAYGAASCERIRDTHQRQVEEMRAAHERQLSHLHAQHERFVEEDKADTRKAIELMQAYHKQQIDEMVGLRSQPDQDADHELREELEAVSEQFSRKCVQLERCVEECARSQDRVDFLRRENSRLQERVDELMNKTYDSSSTSSSNAGDSPRPADAVFRLQMQLRVKSSQVEYLEETNESLNKELEGKQQDIKASQQKQQKLAEEMSLAKSREEQLRRQLDELTATTSTSSQDSTSSGADYHKSPSNETTNVKRNNSDRS